THVATQTRHMSRLTTPAEDRGFEPLRACTQHAFQACALGHYANPPPKRIRVAWPGSTHRVRNQAGLRLDLDGRCPTVPLPAGEQYNPALGELLAVPSQPEADGGQR